MEIPTTDILEVRELFLPTLAKCTGALNRVERQNPGANSRLPFSPGAYLMPRNELKNLKTSLLGISVW